MCGGSIDSIWARLLTVRVDIERKKADESAGDGIQLREGSVDKFLHVLIRCAVAECRDAHRRSRISERALHV